MDELNLNQLEAALQKIEKQQNLSCEEEDSVYNTITEIGAKFLSNYEKFLWPFLHCSSEMIREAAIRALTRLNLPKFKDVAYEIWNDSSKEELERSYALYAWCKYFKNSKDSHVLESLYKVLSTYTGGVPLRINSFLGIIDVCGDWKSTEEYFQCSKIAFTLFHNELNRAIDWGRIHSLMQRYAPQVPLVKFEDLPKDSDEEPQRDGYLN
jgi:hypothetical protein